ncbi:MAG TPA: NirA family protein [Candidatus Limnocylindria bacterium]|nr:NirA family protein [Candidatus Limnocylindria bacterium]
MSTNIPTPFPVSTMNRTPLPFSEIAGQKLTPEQSAYLEGMFAGLQNRGLRFQDVMPNPAALPTGMAKINLDDLIPEERIKHELHPLDAYPLLLQHAASNQAPDKENTFRFKWQGLFYLTPNKEAFMCRMRIPGGALSSGQLRSIAKIADELTTGYIQITTRANLQIRLIEPKNAPEVLRRIQATGLHSRGAGADNIRNLTCDPTSGIDPAELIPTLPIAEELGHLIINHREFYDLPRKFNIAFHGGGAISTVEDTNDIGLKAVLVVPPAEASKAVRSGDIISDQVEPGVYFRVALGGATGHKTFARDMGVLVKPDQAIKVCTALLRVYIAHGNRTDRKKARLKHLLESWTLEQYRAETEKLLGFELLRVPSQAEAGTAKPLPPHPHVGVYKQKQAGLNWVGVAVPVGQLTTKQMYRLAELADLYGSGDLRLTVWQNLIIPNVADTYLETLKKALVKAGFDWRQSNLRSGFIACTGNSYCKFAGANTKGHALELADYLDKRVQLDHPINVHLTGCPNSCAQHYMGDIGLLGAKIKVGGESMEGYHVFVGGGFGDSQAVGRQLFQGVSMQELKTLLERMLKIYLKVRAPGETFQQFTHRHDVGKLQELFSPVP